MNIPRFSIRHPSLVWLMVVAAAAWGVRNYFTMSHREDPEVEIAMALVITVWPGKGAEDIEQRVTRKLEDELEELSGLEEMKSITRENLSLIIIDMDFGVDTDIAWQQLRNKIDEARPNLPEGVIGPDVMDDFGDVTAMVWSMSSKTASPSELKKHAEELRRQLQEVDTVGTVSLIGEQEEVVYIEGPLDSFSMYGFSPLTAAKILEHHNPSIPAGYVRSQARNLRLDTTGSFELIEQIENAVIDVSRETGHPLRVRDVFSVRRGFREPPHSKMLTNGDPSIGIDVRMRQGENIVAMGNDVRKAAAVFQEQLPKHIQLNLLHDQPREVREFVGDFQSNLFEGLFIVVLVMLLAMGARATLIVAVSLPVSIVATVAIMPYFDVDVETVSVAAFIIALGMLVDNAIIVIDNVDRLLQSGMDRVQAAVRGTGQLMRPVLSGTLATVGAFAPLLLMQAESGAYVRALPIVVCISLLLSFILAITVTPLMAAGLLRRRQPKEESEAVSSRLRAAYESLMHTGMRLRYLVLVLTLAALTGAVALVPVVGLSFFPEVDRDQFTVDIWLPEGSSIERTERTVREVEAILKQEPLVQSFASYIGEGGPRFHITVMPQFNTLNYARVMVMTRDKNGTRALVDRLKEKMRKEIAGAHVEPSNLLMGVPVEAPIAIKVSGSDTHEMQRISRQIQEILRDIPGSDMVRDNMGDEVQSLAVNIDSEAATMFGVTGTDVALALLTVHEGLPATHMNGGEDPIPVVLRALDSERRSFRTLDEVRVTSMATGAKIPLSAFASVEPRWAPGVIHRVNNRRTVTVLSGVRNRLAADVMREAAPRIAALELPKGYSVRSEGEEKERNKAFSELIVIFALVILALLFMLVVQFNSIKRAVTILSSVPLAIVGAVLGLLLSGNSFGFMAFLGLISLAGMVIKNAVVWLEFVDTAQAEGQSLEAAIVDAGIKRLRPIMLTAGTTIGGLLPLAFFGGVLWEGMAWAMVAGLAASTILTLIVVPIIYYLMFRSSQPAATEDGGTGHHAARAAAALLVLGLTGAPGQAAAAHPVEQYVAEARDKAVLNRAAAVEVDAARVMKRQALSSFFPKPEFTAAATRLDQAYELDLADSPLGAMLPAAAALLPAGVDPASLKEPIPLTNRNIYQLTGKVTLPLFVGGKRFAYVAAAESGIAARELGLEATQRGVEFGTVAGYVRVVEARRLVQIWQQRLEADQRLVAIATRKVDVGLAVHFDVSYAETIAADTERQLEMARSEVMLRQHSFNHLVGRAIDAEVELQGIAFDTEFNPDAGQLLAEADGLPEVRASAEARDAMDEQVSAARGGLLPTLAVIGEGGYKKGELGYRDGRLFWQVTAAVQWNALLDATAWTKIEQANVDASRTNLELEQARRDTALKIIQALQQFRDTERIFAVAARAVTTAESGHENANKAYEKGALPMATLVEAAKALVEARLNHEKARTGRLLTELQVRYAVAMPLLTAVHLETVEEAGCRVQGLPGALATVPF